MNSTSSARPLLRSASTVAAAVVVLALSAGCSGATAASPEAGGVTVETVLGEVTVPDRIESVVVIEGRRDLDIALSLGLPVVGFPREEEGALELESPLAGALDAAVASGAEPLFLADEINVEAIAAAAPSLIISRSDDVEPILEELQVIAPVLAIGEQDVSTWQDDLRLVGRATGTLDRADELIAEYEAAVAEVSSTYADVIAAHAVAPIGIDSDGSQVRPNRLLSTVLRDVGAMPTAAFAEAVESGEGVEYGPEQLYDAHRDADGIVALVNVADEWAAVQENPLWSQLPAVQAGHVVRSDKSTHEGGPMTAMHAIEVVESLYASF
ncbi:ABC transporter substrate-binding protein [Rathayibacter sp. VKM Ac-2803]|uniref:ABC transporter substrate-binding protein n=1 Tax=unclassified Rathayibacter TaxID=2609250 RepID=UPI00135B7E1D|nr:MULTISPECIES: ABC transporter substrate-binding protein [unclassified Rathayibacter]MWV51150.1 ABC transporter substrate-binding protein [Rathayibacter sp. VKM Ac-2803]MWV57635.1 ABC transporter substrate-binding protein [Rathayibacter sp. VKM Ac-2754]